MKKLFALFLILTVAFTFSLNSEPPKPLKGKIVSLNDIVGGGTGKVNKEQAQELAEKGNPIVFMVGNGKSAKIYFVYNEDGTFAGKKLAKYANNENVGIIGKIKKVNGLNIIIAETIESMD